MLLFETRVCVTVCVCVSERARMCVCVCVCVCERVRVHMSSFAYSERQVKKVVTFKARLNHTQDLIRLSINEKHYMNLFKDNVTLNCH